MGIGMNMLGPGGRRVGHVYSGFVWEMLLDGFWLAGESVIGESVCNSLLYSMEVSSLVSEL